MGYCRLAWLQIAIFIAIAVAQPGNSRVSDSGSLSALDRPG